MVAMQVEVHVAEGLVSHISLTTPPGRPRDAPAWLHVNPRGSSPLHVRPHCAAQPPDPIPSHSGLCADTSYYQKKRRITL